MYYKLIALHHRSAVFRIVIHANNLGFRLNPSFFVLDASVASLISNIIVGSKSGSDIGIAAYVKDFSDFKLLLQKKWLCKLLPITDILNSLCQPNISYKINTNSVSISCICVFMLPNQQTKFSCEMDNIKNDTISTT